MHLSTNLGMGKSFNRCIGSSINQVFFGKSYTGMFEFLLQSKATLSPFPVVWNVVGSIPYVQWVRGWFVWLGLVCAAPGLALMWKRGRCLLALILCCFPGAAA